METPQPIRQSDGEKADDGRPSKRSATFLSISAALSLLVTLLYLLQPDRLAAATLVPAWCWLFPAAVLAGFGFSRRHRFWSLGVTALWIGFAAVFVEEPRSLIRGIIPPTSINKTHGGIRVVTLNCAVGNPLAAAEVAEFQPDIVLLQESPGREQLEALAHDLFGDEGDCIWGGDTSILARGTIRPRTVDTTGHFVHAEVELPSGLRTEVVSLRLEPPVFRLDFWMPGFWADHRDKRVTHRQQIRDVVERIDAESVPTIVGGDFNAPPRDGALTSLGKDLRDAHNSAGRGWGNTGTNSHPLFRVDQIWVSEHFDPELVTARKTVHSDHRMVVCDLMVK